MFTGDLVIIIAGIDDRLIGIDGWFTGKTGSLGGVIACTIQRVVTTSPVTILRLLWPSRSDHTQTSLRPHS
jgi:hypothetical protein